MRHVYEIHEVIVHPLLSKKPMKVFRAYHEDGDWDISLGESADLSTFKHRILQSDRSAKFRVKLLPRTRGRR